MIKNFKRAEKLLVKRARELGKGCKKVFVAVSGGVDSSLIVAILCKAYGPKNVVGMFRNIRSSDHHWEDVKTLQNVFKFRLMHIDGNPIYDEIVRQIKNSFERQDLPWADEGTARAEKLGFTNAYASLKSRLTTPMAGFIAKAIDRGEGRIFGTGNLEEDGVLRYFDKYGDGAVDSNILNGLNKAEVRQLALFMGVPKEIVTKKASADLESNGDKHNDESQLSDWARKLGHDVEVTYGASDGSEEGNVAWAMREDMKKGVLTGSNSGADAEKLSKAPFNYSSPEIKIILFLRHIEKVTRHKVEVIPGLDRKILLREGVVD
jgi:NAD+ synthase